MKHLLTAFCILSVVNVQAQRTVDVNKMENVNESMFMSADGQPFVNVKFVRLVDGSPYFADNWLKGTVVLISGKIAAGGQLKLDLLDNEVHYLDKQGREMVATTPLKEITLSDSATNAVFHFVHSSVSSSPKDKHQWYLQLTSGKARLFKFFNKVMLEHKPYGSATVEQTIETREEFYILKDNTFIPIKKIKDMPDVLSTNRSQLESYLKSLEKGKRSAEDKMIALVNFYNSLQ